MFDIVIPEGVVVVDKRPGVPPVEEPEWMKIKNNNAKIAQQNFDEARMALAAGEYQKAAELFKNVVETQPGSNWAWFWLGKAHYELGEYDSAIYEFSKVIEMLTKSFKVVPHYCYLARGFAFAAKGMKDMAQRDFETALPVMIDALRNIKSATSFDYADDPLYKDLPEDKRPTAEQSLAMMINRLRLITGQNFGYDPNASAEENERAIAAWEDWFKTSGRIQFTPDAELVHIPMAPRQQ
jgi:tetratricopeptide (TPR) repeat protein